MSAGADSNSTDDSTIPVDTCSFSAMRCMIDLRSGTAPFAFEGVASAAGEPVRGAPAFPAEDAFRPEALRGGSSFEAPPCFFVGACLWEGFSFPTARLGRGGVSSLPRFGSLPRAAGGLRSSTGISVVSSAAAVVGSGVVSFVCTDFRSFQRGIPVPFMDGNSWAGFADLELEDEAGEGAGAGEDGTAEECEDAGGGAEPLTMSEMADPPTEPLAVFVACFVASADPSSSSGWLGLGSRGSG